MNQKVKTTYHSHSSTWTILGGGGGGVHDPDPSWGPQAQHSKECRGLRLLFLDSSVPSMKDDQ